MGDIALLVVGALLLVAALLAGGRLARAIGLAGLGAATRLALAGVGAMCVLAGVILLGNDPPAKGTVTATIKTEMDPRLASDRMQVFIDGRAVGVLSTTTRSPKDTLKITVSKAGRHDYKLVVARQVKGQKPTTLTRSSNLVISGHEPLYIYYNIDKTIQPSLSPPL